MHIYTYKHIEVKPFKERKLSQKEQPVKENRSV